MLSWETIGQWAYDYKRQVSFAGSFPSNRWSNHLYIHTGGAFQWRKLPQCAKEWWCPALSPLE